MRLCSIASGSSGNCIYAGSDSTHVIIDAGISGKRIEAGLNEIGITGRELNGVLITHEHSDHISGLGVLARKFGIPMYATPKTIEAILHTSSIGKIDADLFHPICPDEPFMTGDLCIHPIKISHDAADPVAYRLEHQDKSIAVVTDLGTFDDYTVDRLNDLDILLLEANHDVRMLQVGSYPYYLKQRILGERGHLSNEHSGQLLCRLLNNKLKSVVLGHLSKENNYEELAYETVRLELHQGGFPFINQEIPIYVAKRDSVSQVLHA